MCLLVTSASLTSQSSVLFGTAQGIIILHSGQCQGPSRAGPGLRVQSQWQAWRKANSKRRMEDWRSAGRVDSQPHLSTSACIVMRSFCVPGWSWFWLCRPPTSLCVYRSSVENQAGLKQWDLHLGKESQWVELQRRLFLEIWNPLLTAVWRGWLRHARYQGR